MTNRALWTTLSLYTLCVGVKSCHASTIDVQFSTIKQYVSYQMSVLKDKQVLWTSTGPEHWAMVCHDRDMILSGSGSRGTVRAHTSSGKRLWRVNTIFGPDVLESYVEAEVSGNILLLRGRGPTPGVSARYVETFKGMLELRRLNAYDMRTGRLLWRTNPLTVGHPIWMNGKVFVSVAYDASKKAIRRYKDLGRPLPIFMEEWSLLPYRRLWRKRIAGDPPRLASVHKAGRHSIRLISEVWDASTFEMSYLQHLSKFSIVIPLLRGGIPKEATKPTLYEIEGIY